MLGLDSEPGIYIRTLNDLFRAIEDSTEDLNCSVYMSYIEVRFIVLKRLKDMTSFLVLSFWDFIQTECVLNVLNTNELFCRFTMR